MAIIKKNDIIESGIEKSLQPLIDAYKNLNDINNKLVADVKLLHKAYSDLSKTNDGKEAKNLVKINTELIKSNKELIKVEEDKKRLSILIQKEEQSLIKTEKDRLSLEKQKATELERTRRVSEKQRIETEKQNSAMEQAKKRLNEMIKAWQNLAIQQKANTKEAQLLLNQIRNLDAQIKSVDASVGRYQRNVGNYMSAFKGMISNFGSSLLTAFGGFQLLSIGKDVIDTTANFEKMAVVLENTLGSKSEAQAALDMVQQFAAETPFSVEELTDAFVRLTNQGFKPTRDDMVKLGDLASSTGKSFNQLAEAILDAKTGEFERLKEFGIKAKKEGDKITFTFKGQETVVKNTSEAIQDYIVGLGNMQGVVGANAKIAETLTGQISNLGDAWDQFLLSLGTKSSGVIKETISLLNDTITDLTKAINIAGDAQAKNGEKARAWTDVFAKANPVLYIFNERLKDSKNGFLSMIPGMDRALSKMRDFFGIKDYTPQREAEQERIRLLKLTLDLVNQRYDKQHAETLKLKEENDARTKLDVGIKSNTKNYKDQLDALDDLMISRGSETDAILEEQRAREMSKWDTAGMQTLTAKVDLKPVDELKALNDMQDKQKKQEDKNNKDRINKEKEVQDAIKEVKQQALLDFVDFSQSMVSQQVDQDLSAKESEIQAEKDLLKDQLDKGLIAETEYKAKIAELDKKERTEEAKAQKKKALYEIAINTAVAVVAALAKGSLVQAAAAGVTGAIKAALVAATPIPKYEKGKVDIKGKRHKEGGILAEIEGGESVINRTGTMNAPKTLDLINKGLLRDKDVLKPKQPNVLNQQLYTLNNTNKLMLRAINNIVSTYQIKDTVFIVPANGSEVKMWKVDGK